MKSKLKIKSDIRYIVAFIAVLCAALFAALLFSLLPGWNDISEKDDLERRREIYRTYTTIVEAARNQDDIALKGLFCEKALEEATDLDSQINDLFDFFQGEIINGDTYRMAYGIFMEGGFVHPNTRREATYYIKTSERIYHLYFYGYTVNKRNPEEEGLYTIYFIDEEAKSVYDELTGKTWIYNGGKLPGIVIENADGYMARMQEAHPG